MAYSKTIGYDNANATRPITYAAQQINYMLGDCGRSWVVGFGENSPVRPYHKSSYNSFIDYPMRGSDNGAQGQDFLNSLTVNRFILYGMYIKTDQGKAWLTVAGALEGGPAWDDTFKDDRSSYEFTDKFRCSRMQVYAYLWICTGDAGLQRCVYWTERRHDRLLRPNQIQGVYRLRP